MSAAFLLRCLLFGLIALPAPLAAAEAEKVFDLVISRGAVPVEQRVLRVVKGDPVRLRFTSDAAGELHLHAYRLEARVTPGAAVELKFNAHAEGRFRIEWHALAAMKSGNPHGPALATLEVRPK